MLRQEDQQLDLTGLRDVTFSRIITILRNTYNRAGYDF